LENIQRERKTNTWGLSPKGTLIFKAQAKETPKKNEKGKQRLVGHQERVMPCEPGKNSLQKLQINFFFC
jgi:hypothetical protein